MSKIRSMIGILIKKYYYSKYYDKRHIEEIKKFHNIHQGKRCFIIGSGPSIKKTNMGLLKNEITFGLNKLYRGNIGFTPTYWVLISRNLHAAIEIVKQTGTILFIAGTCGRIHSKYSYYMKYPIIIKDMAEIKVWDKISRDLTKGTMTGKMVVFEALQIAYYMGFTEIYLVGMDHSNMGNYFFSNVGQEKEYFNNPKIKNVDGKKKILDRPTNFKEIFETYEIVKKEFEKDERHIYNATVEGELEVFERKKLGDVVK